MHDPLSAKFPDLRLLNLRRFCSGLPLHPGGSIDVTWIEKAVTRASIACA
jgi:hypothetical protein